MGCSSSKHTALDADDDYEGLLHTQSDFGKKSAFALPEQPHSRPETHSFLSTVVESEDLFANFDAPFPADFGGGTSTDTSPTMSPNNNTLPVLSGHKIQSTSPPSISSIKSSPSCSGREDQQDEIKNDSGIVNNTTGRFGLENRCEIRDSNDLNFEGNAGMPREAGATTSSINVKNTFDNTNPAQLFDETSKRFEFNFGDDDDDNNNNANDNNLCEKNERDDDDDCMNDDNMSINFEDDQLQVVKTTEDGAQYLELSMEFLKVDLNLEEMEQQQQQQQNRRGSLSAFSSMGSVISNATRKGKERRRGRRRDHNKDVSTDNKTEDDETSLGSKRKKKHRHHRHKDNKGEELQRSSTSIKTEDLEGSVTSMATSRDGDKHASFSSRLTASSSRLHDSKASIGSKLHDSKASIGSKLHDSKTSMGSKLHDSKTSMGSKKKSKKSKKKKKSKKNKHKDKKDKSESSNNGAEESSSGAILPEMDFVLNSSVEAELDVVDDLWMGDKKDQDSKALTDVRAVKLAVSMPGDYENGLLGKQAAEKDRERSLVEIIDIDPWDREGSKYSDNAAMSAMERDSRACTRKHDFEAFGNELYPFSMLCAIGASLETVQKCYETFPAAMEARDPTVGSPLHYACAYAGSPQLVEWLIEKNPGQLNEVDVLQRSPFHVACLYSARVATLRVLIAKSPKGLEAKDYENNTTLHVAAEHDAPVDVIQLLLKHYPEALSMTRKDGSTPLHLAVESGADVSKIKALLKVDDSALKIADNKGQRPIHLSLMGPIVDAKTVKYLVKGYPAALQAITNEGETPHTIAQRLHLDKSIQSLLQS